MPLRRSYWPAERPTSSFTDALTARTAHECPDWYLRHSPHDLAACPGHVRLSDLLRELEAAEGPEEQTLDPRQLRGRRMFRARQIMGQEAWYAATTPDDLAAALREARERHSRGDDVAP